MSDNDNILSEEQMHRVYDVARAVNVVNVKVEALRRQVEQHIAAEDGADPVEGLREKVLALCAERDALRARVAELEALYQAGQDYANARCQERSDLVAEIDKWKARAKALEPDAALDKEATDAE